MMERLMGSIRRKKPSEVQVGGGVGFCAVGSPPLVGELALSRSCLGSGLCWCISGAAGG